MKKTIIFTFGLFLALASFGGITGNDVLKKVDDRTVGKEAPKDIQMKMIMKIISSSGSEKMRELKAWSKNLEGKDDWRVMKFMSPPDVKDVGFLVLSDDQMYLYLPEFRRIRRIASHNKKDKFMGSDFSYDDLSASVFSKYYNAELIHEEETEWVLSLERKPGVEKPYKKIEMWVSKEYSLPSKMKLYDNSGNLWKETEQEINRFGKYWIPVKITMKDMREKSQTLLQMKDISVDQGLDDSLFTQRFLKRRVS